MKLIKAVAMKVSQLLIKSKMSQYALSQKTGLTKQTIASIINEKNKTIKLDTLIKIADCFNLSLNEFFSDEIFSRENLDVE